MDPTTLYTGTSGLNTVLDPQRLSQGSDNDPGMIELAVAVNVSIDDRGMVSLRKGSALAQLGEFHSLFCDGGDCFVIQERVSDAALMRVAADLSISEVWSGLTKNCRMSFTQVNYDTFYSNGQGNGYIRSGVSAAWPVGVYQGPDTNLHFSPAPVGNIVAFKPGGLMLIAVGPVLWINYAPFAFGLYNLRSGFVQFGSDITMICPVFSGVFVSDSERTWFLRGESWFDFVQEPVADCPALKWSLATEKVRVRDMGDMGVEMPGFGRVWASTEGVCVGMDDGTMINLTKEKINYPGGHDTGACLITDTHIIHTTP